MHEKERHRIILAAVQEKPVVDRAGAGRADRARPRRRSARHRRAACAEAAAPGARRRRGAHPAAVRRPCRPAVQRQRDAATSARSARSPARRWRLRRRRADHHQRRHHHLPDGAFPGQPPACRSSPTPSRSPSTCSSTRKNTVMLSGRHDLPRAEHHPVAVRQRRDPQFLRPAHVHGRAGPRPARPDGGRPAADPGRAEADQPGRRAGACWSTPSKFGQRSSLILCGLDRIATVITDDGSTDAAAKMLENAGVRLIVAEHGCDQATKSPSAA